MKNNHGIIIFLNGPSSVGKGQIARLLQEMLLPTPFLHVGIDSMIDMMPQSLNSWTGERRDDGFWWRITHDERGRQIAHIEAGPYAQKVSDSLKEIAITLLKQGHNLIIDEVCVFPGSFAQWQKALKPFNSVYVGLMAKDETLERREQERKDRMTGSARAQNKTVHQGNTYDIYLDTDALSLEDCAQSIIELLVGGFSEKKK